MLYCMTLQFIYVFFIADPGFQGRSTERQADLRTKSLLLSKNTTKTFRRIFRCWFKMSRSSRDNRRSSYTLHRPWQGEESAARGPARGEWISTPPGEAFWQNLRSNGRNIRISFCNEKQLSDRVSTAKEGLVSVKEVLSSSKIAAGVESKDDASKVSDIDDLDGNMTSTLAWDEAVDSQLRQGLSASYGKNTYPLVN